MASSSSSSTVSSEDFKLFHTIDRGIFARLVVNLRRDIAESMNVMALLLWLEHCKFARNLIYEIQLWPDSLINALADEAVNCLACVESVEYPFDSVEDSDNLTPLIRKVTDNDVSLRFIHDNRLHVIRGIVKLVQQVCVRAFGDIAEKVLMVNSMAADEVSFEENLEPIRRLYGPLIRPVLPAFDYSHSGVLLGNAGDQSKGNEASQQVIVSHEFGITGDQSNGNDQANQQTVNKPKSKSDHDSGFLHGSNLGAQSKSPKDDMEEMINTLNSICIGLLDEEDNNNKNSEVPADDRTMFLTFSKGYPISKTEVTDFFTRKFGVDLIDGVEMQDVPEGGQPLYAKLVLRSASGLETILNGQPKAKFSINGKHVWARKFRRRYPALQVTISNE